MDSEIAVSVNGVSKYYPLYRTPRDRLMQFIVPPLRKLIRAAPRQYFTPFWAIRDISFQLRKGETVGIVGRNGAGKSTLLQMLCGTVTPTSGSIETFGRVAALLELGAGFNPEFTGRENILMSGAVLGFSQEEMETHFDEILAFSEIGEFVDRPVKSYSSGMYVRLAFSVAVSIKPDILVVDEALSVGDVSFQHKCLKQIEQLKGRGTTILFVSHDVAAIKRFCARALWIDGGKLVADGSATRVADQYFDAMRKSARETERVAGLSKRIENTSIGEIRSVVVVRRQPEQSAISLGDQVTFDITFEVRRELDEPIVVGLAIFRSDDLYVCGLNTGLDNVWVPCSKGIHTVRLTFPRLNLYPGTYYVKAGLFDQTGMVRWHFDDMALRFEVVAPYIGEGVVLLDHQWHIGSLNDAES